VPILQTVITGLLILAGAVILAFSLVATNKILRLVPGGLFKNRWRVLTWLTIFFLAGYLISFILNLLNQTSVLDLITGVIFLGGAYFVYLVTQVSQGTIHDLTTTTVSKSYFDRIIQSMADALIVTELDLTISMVNQKVVELTGYDEGELAGKKVSFLLNDLNLTELSHRDEENEIRTRTGRTIPVLFSSSVFSNDDGKSVGIVHTIRDITYRKHLEAELIHNASHDTLTGLPNRPFIVKHLEQVLGDDTSSPSSSPSIAVIFLDLDNFKDVNDSLGHTAGDLILAMVSRRLEKCVRSRDIVGRLGGDEFVILIEKFLSRDEASLVTERVLKEMQTPLQVMGHEIRLTASMGIALAGQELRLAGDILKAADIAMYEAKKQGKARYEFYHPSMQYIRKGI